MYIQSILLTFICFDNFLVHFLINYLLHVVLTLIGSTEMNFMFLGPKHTQCYVPTNAQIKQIFILLAP